ncbi:MAG: helix-turn-helix transcriptional regulator [Halodesulfurarchaeum sp.]
MISDPGAAREIASRRRPVLEALEDESLTKPELVAEVEVSRSTIDRAVRELEEAGLATRRDGRVSLTKSGAIALEAHRWLFRTYTGLAEATELLNHIGDGSTPHPVFFDGAGVVVGSQAVPRRPVNVMSDIVSNANSIRGVALSVEPQMVTAGRNSTAERGAELEVVLPERVVAALIEEYETAFSEVLEAGADIQQTDADPPFGLLICEQPDRTVAALSVYAESGMRGLITNESPLALAWARDYVASWLDRARKL